MKYILVTTLTLVLNTGCSAQNVEKEKAELLAAIKLPENTHSIESFEEWYPNRDGYYLARYILDSDTKTKVFSKPYFFNCFYSFVF